jgi:exoribonuclease R
MIDESSGLLEVGIHIADPTQFIVKDSLVDKEALNRTTTINLVQKSLPMLPPILSENICSLVPFKDRLAISSTFRIYYHGALDTTFTPKIFLSVINSSAKWNYELIHKIINNEEVNYEDLNENDGTKPKTHEKFIKLMNNIKMLHKLTKLVRSQRLESGSLNIDETEVEFTLQEDSCIPFDFKIKSKDDSHYLIEELMLISNKLTADYIYDNLRPHALVRKHSFLNDAKFQEIQRYLTSNKVIVDFEDPIALNELLMKLKKSNQNKFIVS